MCWDLFKNLVRMSSISYTIQEINMNVANMNNYLLS